MKLCNAFAAFLAFWSLAAILSADEPTLADKLEKLAPHAAGLAEVEVVKMEEVDARPGDGPLSLDVHFKILRGSGVVHKRISIIKELGGHQGPNAEPFKPYGPVKVDTFQAGGRYWVAFSSKHEWDRCPQGVVRAWPAKGAPRELAAAMEADLYREEPVWHPKSGLTFSHRVANDKKSWFAILERDDQLLWVREIPGVKYFADGWHGQWDLLSLGQWGSGLNEADRNRSDYYLFAETSLNLVDGNPYGLAVGPHRVTYAFDADTGKTVAIWVSTPNLGPTSTPRVIHYLDTATGKLRREERFDSLDSGGIAAGGADERWYRQTIRLYEPATGKLKSENFFRHASTPEGSKFLPVNKP